MDSPYFHGINTIAFIVYLLRWETIYEGCITGGRALANAAKPHLFSLRLRRESFRRLRRRKPRARPHPKVNTNKAAFISPYNTKSKTPHKAVRCNLFSYLRLYFSTYSLIFDTGSRNLLTDSSWLSVSMMNEQYFDISTIPYHSRSKSLSGV